MKKLFLFLFATALAATVNEPLRCEVFSGYRNDRIHWYLPGQSTLYRNVQFWENGLTLKAIHRDLTFFMRGSYSAFGKGTVSQTPTSGWAADAAGYFGYAVNLTADRLYRVILTPLVGYSACFERLDPTNLRLVWNGFFVGGGFTVDTTGRLVFNAGYSYHFMHNRVHAQSIKANGGGAHGQTGWLQLDWKFDSIWRAGIGSQIHYFFTRTISAKVEDSRESFHLRWSSLSGWVQISRQF